MRRAWPFAVMGALAVTIAVLILNLRERDYYPEALDAAPPGPVNVDPDDAAFSWLPATQEHGGCVHPAEFSENHRWMRLRDRDGWYRLFWAADETYYYDDPSAFNQGLNNGSARDPAGEWRIVVTYRPPAGCARPPETFRMRFDLEVGDGGASPSPPNRIRWFVGRTSSGIRSIDWVLKETRSE